MKDPTQAGWYEESYGSTDQLRYWDGERWTSMTMSKDSNAAIGEEYVVRNPNPSSVSVMKIAFLISNAAVKLSISIGVIFIMSIIPVMIFGGWKIGGVSLFAIGSFISQCAVICALVSAAVALPVIAICRKVLIRIVMAEQCKEDKNSYLRGELTKDDYDKSCKENYLIWRLNNSSQNVVVFTWICTALIAFILHDPLMMALGNPWADLIDLLLILAAGVAISNMLAKSVRRKFRKEFPLEYENAERTLAGIMREI